MTLIVLSAVFKSTCIVISCVCKNNGVLFRSSSECSSIKSLIRFYFSMILVNFSACTEITENAIQMNRNYIDVTK